MGSWIGDALRIQLFGESHGKVVGIVMDGLEAGLELDEEQIRQDLRKRRPKKEVSQARREEDEYQILSGYYQGHTTGTPLTVIFPNLDIDERPYEEWKDFYRPSHSDYVSMKKYHGWSDLRGGGHFSGRLTTPLVFAGSLAKSILKKKGIQIGTRIFQIGAIQDDILEEYPVSMIQRWEEDDFPVENKKTKEKYLEYVREIKEQKDSIGGILESVILAKPYFIGAPFFDSIEAKLSSYLFAIPSLKGIEFGDGFSFASKKGSEVNDLWIKKGDDIVTKTNHNGGINGGISNGMPIVFKTVIKPTSSIGISQETWNFKEEKMGELKLNGRHDACIALRVPVIQSSLIALAILDLAVMEYGKSWML